MIKYLLKKDEGLPVEDIHMKPAAETPQDGQSQGVSWDAKQEASEGASWQDQQRGSQSRRDGSWGKWSSSWSQGQEQKDDWQSQSWSSWKDKGKGNWQSRDNANASSQSPWSQWQSKDDQENQVDVDRLPSASEGYHEPLEVEAEALRDDWDGAGMARPTPKARPSPKNPMSARSRSPHRSSANQADGCAADPAALLAGQGINGLTTGSSAPSRKPDMSADELDGTNAMEEPSLKLTSGLAMNQGVTMPPASQKVGLAEEEEELFGPMPETDPLLQCLSPELRKQIRSVEPEDIIAECHSLRWDPWPEIQLIGGSSAAAAAAASAAGANGFGSSGGFCAPESSSLRSLSERLLCKLEEQTMASAKPPPASGDHVQLFIHGNKLGPECESALRGLPDSAKLRVIRAGPVVGQDREAVFLSRIRRALEGLSKPMTECDLQGFIADNWIGTATERVLRGATVEVQKKVMQKGPLLGPCPQKELLFRLERLEAKAKREARDETEPAPGDSHVPDPHNAGRLAAMWEG